jgi:hypothetical protein
MIMKRAVVALVAVVVLVGVGGGAFYYGTKVGENRVLQNPQLLFQQLGAGQQGGTFQRQFQGQFPGASGTPQAGQRGTLAQGGGLTGTIEQIEGNTVVITTDAGSVRVQTSDTTLIEKTMSVGVGDLTVGERVIVSGSQNDDGSYTARSIQSLRGMQVTGSDQTQGR